MSPFANAYLSRRSVGQSHPVHDFLFTYYSFSPAKLKHWVPCYGEKLAITPKLLQEYPWLTRQWFHQHENLLTLNLEHSTSALPSLAQFIAQLCRSLQLRPMRLGCFGLHEWAMVYKLSDSAIRHSKWRLRLPPDQLATFVKSQTLCCTHYDAYRFFTSEAKPLNLFVPTLNTRLNNEQPGCLHANMDLYKWTTKLWPWVGSELIAKTFMLALEAREIDMRASPYDLAELGYAPICIETEEGRRQFQEAQHALAEQAMPLRLELITFCDKLINSYHQSALPKSAA
jgi:hypothetical protein